jgi:hypothetical protein
MNRYPKDAFEDTLSLLRRGLILSNYKSGKVSTLHFFVE